MTGPDRNRTQQPVDILKGVGKSRARLFNKLGVCTVEDILYYYPRDYEDRRKVKALSDLTDGETCTVRCTVVSHMQETRPGRKLSIQKIRIQDETGRANCVWFNQGYLKRVFRQGQQYAFYGRVSKKFGVAEIQSPEHVEAHDVGKLCGIAPVYPLTAGLTQKVVRNTIKAALEYVDCGLEDMLTGWIREKYKLCELNYSIKNIHFPEDEKALENARYRLSFQELMIIQTGLLLIRKTIRESTTGISFRKVSAIDVFLKNIPFELTGAQKRVVNEIAQDMGNGKVMNRLLVGDVGSGKTVVAVISILRAIYNGYQAAMMVPTEILAEQHYNTVKDFLSGTDINIALLTGGTPKDKKQQIRAGIEKGTINLVIGTHALIQEGTAFKSLGLVVTDEQHRFGVRQRAVFSGKGENPDVLVMTATPIPRTLALILYGDLDISVLDEMPPGRKPVKTYDADESMRDRINAFIRKKVKEGSQVFIVCPLVEESDKIDASSAVELAEKISKKDFTDLRVRMIHGKMKSLEKDEIMRSFSKGEIDILVSTTVIEVGVDVPNASVMVVENAERFGLAQLHQLRGRVGRGSRQSYCILYKGSKSGKSVKRIKTMVKTNNGFSVAEKDLELRGPGDFFGTRQHGLPELRIANLYRDMEILKKAQEAAQIVVEHGKSSKALDSIIQRKFENSDLTFN